MAKVYCTADNNTKQHFYVETKGKSYSTWFDIFTY